MALTSMNNGALVGDFEGDSSTAIFECISFTASTVADAAFFEASPMSLPTFLAASARHVVFVGAHAVRPVLFA